MDTTKNVSIRDLQQLNDAIAWTMDAIQRISPQVQTGLTHTAYGQIPLASTYVGAPLAMDPFGVVRSGLDHAAYANRTAFGSPFGAYGVGPFAQSLAANAALQAATIDPFTREAIARGLLHSQLGAGPFGAGAFAANPLVAANMASQVLPQYGTWGNVQYVPVRTW